MKNDLFLLRLFIYFMVAIALVSCGKSKFRGDTAARSPEEKTAPKPVEKPIATPTPTPEYKDLNTPPPPSKSLEFGEDGVYHIGDNDFEASSCKEEIKSYPLSGNTFEFYFEVLEPNTNVSIVFNKVCGVDYSRGNTVQIFDQNGNDAFKAVTIKNSDNKIEMGSKTIQPGLYVIRTHSPINYSRVAKGDHDDFIVGQIKIRGDKLMQKKHVNSF